MTGRRILIAGFGTAGRSLAEDVAHAGDTVVGYVDDDQRSAEVLGTLTDVASVVDGYRVDAVYFAIPSARGEVVREFTSLVTAAGVEYAIVPRTYRIMSRERVSVADLTDVDVLDFVGRAPVKHDMIHARELIAGKRILVTGAAGSIGSRIVAQLASLDPETVVCADRSEPACSGSTSSSGPTIGSVSRWPTFSRSLGSVSSWSSTGRTSSSTSPPTNMSP